MQFALKTKKNRRFYVPGYKALLFAGLLAFIAWKLSFEDWSGMNALDVKHPSFLIAAFLLIFLNQWCEWMKWKLIANKLFAETMQSRQAFFSGIGVGFMTPNGWGNFIGRAAHFRSRDRVFIMIATFISNVSQVLPTIIFGAIACFYTNKLPQQLGWFAAGAGLLILPGFFFGERFLPRGPSRNKYVRRLRILGGEPGVLRWPMFLWSNLRFQVFTTQYLLLFLAFGYTDVTFLVVQTWLLFLLTSFVPSLWSGKIVIRETAAIFLFSGTMVAVPDALLVCLLIWLMNAVIPAIVSSFHWLPLFKAKMNVVD